MALKAELIFYGGNIITMDANLSSRPEEGCTVEAVAIADGKIIQVGNEKDVFCLASKDTQIISLNGQTLMPGFIEPHQHACLCAENNGKYTDIGGVTHRSYSEVSVTIKKRLQQLEPDEWGLFVGWDPELIPDLPILSASYVDENYSSTVPILIIGQNWHVGWVNTMALEAANITMDTPNPDGGTIVRDEKSLATGQLLEFPGLRLMFDVYPEPHLEKVLKGFRDQWRYYSSVGFTTVTELAFMPSDFLRMILVFLACESDCPIRLALYKLENASTQKDLKTTMPSQNEFNPRNLNKELPASRAKEIFLPASLKREDSYIKDRLWIAGIKMMADGSPHCGSAAIQEPFLDNNLTKVLGFPKSPNCGKLNMETGALIDALKFYTERGTQVAIHAQGERATDQVIAALEKAICEDGKNVNRHRIEHCGLTTVAQLARAAKTNITISFFVDHLRFYAHSFQSKIFGERVNRWAPLSAATKAGILWTIHQDHPAFPGSARPFSNMKTAVTRCFRDDPTIPYGPEYRVSIHEALKAYTINAAWQLHRDHDLGSITPGKKADLVVLSKNPYQVDPFDLESIEVIETYLDGRSNGFATVKSVQGKNFSLLERRVD